MGALMGMNPRSWKWFRRDDCSTVESQHPELDDLLFRLEFAESEGEQKAVQAELDVLVEADPEAARIYEMHQLLERELHALFESGACLADLPPPSPMRRLFLWVRSFFCPGPVG